MPKIHFVFPDGAEARYGLEGDAFTIGRAGDNDMVLPDPRVSAHHLVLKRSQSGNFIINDLGATNPTRVNGQAATLAELSDGDTLLIGDTYARYEAPENNSAATHRPLTRPTRHPSDPAAAQTGCFALLLASTLLTTAAATAAWAVW